MLAFERIACTILDCDWRRFCLNRVVGDAGILRGKMARFRGLRFPFYGGFGVIYVLAHGRASTLVAS